MKLLTLSLLVGVIGFGISDVAKSQTVDVYKDLNLGILMIGLQPNSTNELVFSGTRVTKTVYSNLCSVLVLKNTASNPLPNQFTLKNVGGKTDYFDPSGSAVKIIDQSTIPVGEISCIDGRRNISNLFNIPYLKNARGDIFIRTVLNNEYSIEYLGSRKKTVKADACGIGKINYTPAFRTEGEFTLNGQTFNPPDERTIAPICVKGNMYYKAN